MPLTLPFPHFAIVELSSTSLTHGEGKYYLFRVGINFIHIFKLIEGFENASRFPCSASGTGMRSLGIHWKPANLRRLSPADSAFFTFSKVSSCV